MPKLAKIRICKITMQKPCQQEMKNLIENKIPYETCNPPSFYINFERI